MEEIVFKAFTDFLVEICETMCKLAKLTEYQLDQIKKWEASLDNIVLLAYEKPAKYADLSEAELKKIRELEKELDVRLIAYK